MARIHRCSHAASRTPTAASAPSGALRFVLTFAGLLLPAAAGAFNSYPTGAAHDKVTDAALERSPWPYASAGTVREAVRQVDWDESERDGLFSYRPNSKYAGKHHFDRNPGVSTKDAFKNARAYMLEQIAEAVQKGRDSDNDGATAALGRALHAIEDFLAHSNYENLCRADRKTIDRLLFNTDEDPPGGLKLTGFDPNATDPEHPTGDTYNHGDFAKDSANKNAEARKSIGGGYTTFTGAVVDAGWAASRVITRVKQGIQAGPMKPGAGRSGSLPRTRDFPACSGPDSLYDFCCSAGCDGSGCTPSCGGTSLAIPAGALPGSNTVAILGAPTRFFFTEDMSYTFDGAWALVCREFRLDSAAEFSSPVTARIEFADSTLAQSDASTAAVYFFDPAFGNWLQVPGGTVDADSSVATFTFTQPGTYAVGARRLGDSAVGACCTGDSTCGVMSESQCAAAGGTFLGAGADCTSNPCYVPPSGACCFGDTCLIMNAETCAEACGYYQGDNAACTLLGCGPVQIAPDAVTDVVVEQRGFVVRFGFTVPERAAARGAAQPELRWVQVHRKTLSSGETVELATVDATPGPHEYRDTAFRAGEAYDYWVELEDAGGARHMAGPWRITTSGPDRPVVVEAGPNPVAHDAATIELYVPAPGSASFEIYAVNGRRVRSERVPIGSAGISTLTWNRRDDGGRRVASGVYTFVVRISGAALAGKFIVLR